MKKTIFMLALVAGTVTFIACKSTKDKGTTSNTNTSTTTNTTASTETLISVAQKKYPSITQTDLDEGKKIFNVDCQKCHEGSKVTSRTEEKWSKIVDWMAPKANLTEAQKTKVLQYILSERALATGNK